MYPTIKLRKNTAFENGLTVLFFTSIICAYISWNGGDSLLSTLEDRRKSRRYGMCISFRLIIYIHWFAMDRTRHVSYVVRSTSGLAPIYILYTHLFLMRLRYMTYDTYDIYGHRHHRKPVRALLSPLGRGGCFFLTQRASQITLVPHGVE